MELTPFVLFDGNCAEAMTFYQPGLWGDLSLTDRLGVHRFFRGERRSK